jgi:hypothetical protein
VSSHTIPFQLLSNTASKAQTWRKRGSV